jgi:hypothetical protein
MNIDELEKDLRYIKSKLEKNSYNPFQPNDYNRGFLGGVHEAITELNTILEEYFK